MVVLGVALLTAASAAGAGDQQWKYAERPIGGNHAEVRSAELHSTTTSSRDVRASLRISEGDLFGPASTTVGVRLQGDVVECATPICSVLLHFYQDRETPQAALLNPRLMQVSALPISHGSSLLITGNDAVIEELRSAERLVFELPLRQAGATQFVFHPHGLAWR